MADAVHEASRKDHDYLIDAAGQAHLVSLRIR